MNIAQVAPRKRFLKQVCPQSILNTVLSTGKIEKRLQNAAFVAEVDQNCKYYSNEDLLGLILNQLIDNALSFRQQKMLHKAYVSISAAEGKMKIAVIDNGIGIPEDKWAVFFDADPIYKARDTASGLDIVRSAVARLGGFVDIYSFEGSVTQVTVTLPNIVN